MPEGFKYFHAIETLSRRKAEVSAEIAKANQKMIELQHAITLLQQEQLNPAQYVNLPSVCSICNGTGCSTCEGGGAVDWCDKCKKWFTAGTPHLCPVPLQLVCDQCRELVDSTSSVGLCATCSLTYRARGVLLDAPEPLPELVRCRDCGDTSAFLTGGRCSTCCKNPRPDQS